MLANNCSPPPLCLLALEAMEPAEEAIKRSITSNKLNNKLGKLPYASPVSSWGKSHSGVVRAARGL